MKILVVAARLGCEPWSEGPIVRAVVDTIADRGGQVTLLVDSAEDPAMFARAETLLAHRPHRESGTDWPLAFPAWVRAQARVHARRHGFDAALSLSRRVAGDVWWPLDPSPSAWLNLRSQALSPPSLALALARHHGVLAARALHALRSTPRTVGRSARVRPCTLARPGAHDDALELPPLLLAAPPSPERQAELRARTRAALSIAEHRRVFLVSLTGPVGRVLDPIAGAIADLSARAGVVGLPGTTDPADAPVLLILGGYAYHAHGSVLRSGRPRSFRVLGTTHAIDAALAACDAAVLALPAVNGAFDVGGAQRFAAEALAAGRPLVALRQSPGARFVELVDDSGVSPGIVVPRGNEADWLRALRTAVGPDWLAPAQRAARAAGAAFRPGATIDAVVDLVARAAEA